MRNFSKLLLAIALLIALTACSSPQNSENTSTIEEDLQTTLDDSIEIDMTTPIKVVNTAPVETIDTNITLTDVIILNYASLDTDTKGAVFSETASAYEIESYIIKMTDLIEFKSENNKLEVVNWVPRDIENVLIIGSFNGEDYKMLHLDLLPGLSTLELPSPWDIGTQKVFKSIDTNGSLDFSTINAQDVIYKFVPQNTLQKSIANIKPSWTLKFPDRVILGKTAVCRPGKNVVWRPTRPKTAIYMLTFMINAAQALSDPKFHEFWMKTPFSDKSFNIPTQDLLTMSEYNNYTSKEKALYSEDNITNGLYYNKAHRQAIYDKYMVKVFALGVTGGGGLGGGSTVGLNHTSMVEKLWTYGDTAVEAYNRGDWYLPLDDKASVQTPWAIFGHETGHALGFNHKRTYCIRSQYSHITVGNIVYTHLLASGKSIVTAETMVGRDLDWEKPYNRWTKNTDTRPRPRCDDAYEWGGSVYGKHNIKLPEKWTDTTNANFTTEWDTYLDEHKKGYGLDYLKSL